MTNYRIALCLLLTAGLGGCPKQGGTTGPGSANEAAADILTLPNGGSSDWDDAVKRILLANFDSNGSGALDSPKELETLGCPTWQAIERSLAAGGEFSVLRQIYGFAPDYIWVGYAIGVDESQRTFADGLLAQCGLTPPG